MCFEITFMIFHIVMNYFEFCGLFPLRIIFKVVCDICKTSVTETTLLPGDRDSINNCLMGCSAHEIVMN